ncbi:hypothetical protein Trisim1_008545 [Trichoderma cf. simile WF8]
MAGLSRSTLDDLLDSGIAADRKDDDGKLAKDYAKQTGLTWAVEKLKSVPSNVPKVRTEVEIQIRSLKLNQHGARGALKTGLGRFAKGF